MSEYCEDILNATARSVTEKYGYTVSEEHPSRFVEHDRPRVDWSVHDGTALTFEVSDYFRGFEGCGRIIDMLLRASMRAIVKDEAPRGWQTELYQTIDGSALAETHMETFRERNHALRYEDVQSVYPDRVTLMNALCLAGGWKPSELAPVTFMWDTDVRVYSDGSRVFRAALLPMRHAEFPEVLLADADNAVRMALGRMPRVMPLDMSRVNREILGRDA